MKRWYYPILIMLLGLTSCTITATPNRVEVTAEKTTVKPGETITLTAKPNFETASDILWRVGSKDKRTADEVFNGDRIGTTVEYTAPQTDGVYRVTAETADEFSFSGSIDIMVDAFLGAERLTAGTDRDTTILSGSLPANSFKLLIIDVPSEVADVGEALYIELDQSLELSVFDSDRGLYASSSSAAFFATGDEGLNSTGLATLDLPFVIGGCRGSCVIQDATATSHFVKIENTTNVNVTYSLYAFVENYQEAGENENDSVSGAISLGSGVSEAGAIESLGDIDYYEAASSGTLTLLDTSWSEVRVDITGSDGTAETLQPGESFGRLRTDDLIKVYEVSGDRAAAAKESKYTILIDP